MFGRLSRPISPFEILFSEVARCNTADRTQFPVHIKLNEDTKTCKGRFNDIVSRHDPRFPDFCANVFTYENKHHILLEGPAQHRAEHSKRFIDVLLNDQVVVTDVIAAGDPFDGRCDKRGFLHYFTPEYDHTHADNKILDEISNDYQITSSEVYRVGQLVSYEVTIHVSQKQRKLNVHHISGFADFSAANFNVTEIARVLQIFEQAQTLAIHCSAGMGRTGMLELAFCLYANHEYYFPGGSPKFDLIKTKLEELRQQRPGLIQRPEQYRMAIILGKKLFAASQRLLTDENSASIESEIDHAASEWMFERAMKKSRTFSGSENEISDVDLDESSSSSELSPIAPRY